jgi:alpha-beta hydrolase superfamily lysophospholipase
METREVLVDAPGVLGEAESHVVAATVFAPQPDAMSARPTLIVAIPGGTYTASYWHLDVPGHPGYSFAERATAAGAVVVTLDNLGTGRSSRPKDADELTFESVAAANAAVAAWAVDAARAGSLHPDLPALPDVFLVGLGHSLGGQLLMVQQARHQSFRRVGVLGSSFLGNAHVESGAVDAAALTADAEVRMRAMAGSSWDDGYLTVPRQALRPQFHAADVPADVLAADDAGATVLPRQLAVAAIASAAAAHYPGQVHVPVFLCFGEVDMSPDPRGEVTLYTSSNDVTLFLLAGSAHCHNLAGTRYVLWDRLIPWLLAP